MSLCIRLPNSIHPQRRCDVISIFKMAAAAAQFYFRFQIGWRRSFSGVSFYQQTKFRSYNSIRDWDITISGLEKQTFTIMEFYFRFWFRPYHLSRHIIPYCSLRNFYQNRTAHGRKITSCRFSRWRNSAILDFRGPIMVFFEKPIYDFLYVKEGYEETWSKPTISWPEKKRLTGTTSSNYKP